jgi:hypothetical protein
MKPNYLQTLETSLTLASIAKNEWKGLECLYSESSSSRCACSKKMSENICTYPKTKSWRKSNYIKDQKIANKITQWLDFQQKKRANK